MTLKDFNPNGSYNSAYDNLVKDFYIPALRESKTYKRIAGFFSSSSLSLAAQGLSEFLKNDGKMQLIANVYLNTEDQNAIREAIEKREKQVIEEIETIDDAISKNHLEILKWMIKQRRLDIKISVVKNGIEHIKKGILIDHENNIITFSGSENETAHGWIHNHEEFHVFCSWIPDDYNRHLKHDLEAFELLWNNEISNKNNKIRVYDISEAFKQNLIRNAPKDLTEIQKITEQLNNDLEEFFETKKERKIPQNTSQNIIKLRDYQNQAIDNWMISRKGILKMATGTGKTITSLALIHELFKENQNKLAVIIACPYKHLVKQWSETAKYFGHMPVLAFESRIKWQKSLGSKITAFNIGAINTFSVITTHSTFGSNYFNDLISRLPSNKTLLIVDEVHHMGAEHLNKMLPKNISWRLGLSATPEDWYDENRNSILHSYFGENVFSFGLKRAIDEGWLTKYFYFPHIVELTEEETIRYYDITVKISNLLSRINKDTNIFSDENKSLKLLLISRARITANAENKLRILQELLKKQETDEIDHTLFYCGDGTLEDERFIEKLTRILGFDLGLKVHPFTAKEKQKIRQDLLKRFDQGQLQGLIAMRCLDEGVDVPSTKTAYILASSTNPRQFIQRRGRVLRKYPGKDYSYIHDFIAVPPLRDSSINEDSVYNTDRRLIEKELKRVQHFTNIAINGPQANNNLIKIKQHYNLLDL